MYGISAATLSDSALQSLSYAYDSVFAKIFKVTNTQIIRFCQYYSGQLCFSLRYDLSRYNFLNNMIIKGQLIDKRKIDALDIQDLNRLRTKYGFTCNDSVNLVKRKVWNYFFFNIDRKL